MKSSSVLLLSIILSAALAAQGTGRKSKVIDLRTIGYPSYPCSSMGYYLYHTRHIEFLDSERLLINFPVDTSGCKKSWEYRTIPDLKRRSVVIDTSANVLHSFDWKTGENMQAGPDGHILWTKGKEIRVLDSAFSLVQTVSPVFETPGQCIEDPSHASSSMGITLAPSRHGFAVQFVSPLCRDYSIVYFEGIEAKQTLSARKCNLPTVTDTGFDCSQDSYATTSEHLKQELPALKWIDAGWPSGWGAPIRSYSTSAAAHRTLFFRRGALITITDSDGGLFKYFRIVIVDMSSKREVFRKQYGYSTEVAISPDGRLLAILENTRLTLRLLP
jgi:hypothetical protein